MADRTIRAVLRAEVAGYKSAMAEAARATAEVGTAAERAASAVVSAKDRQAQAALKVEQAERSLAQVVSNSASSEAQKTAATTGLHSARLELTQATSGLEVAERKVTDAAEVQNSAMGRMLSSARDNRQEWTQVGSVLLGVGAAITAVGAASIRTGLEYNTLQQTTRAALTTMLGSAEAVESQMAAFDDFASTSPFARQVFLSAQQQLLGFGVEADRVIPILDGVQNAVAAVGGGNMEIERVTYALAQMQASGKLSGETLRDLGIYGIDAAGILGEQFGMTGAQIREMAFKPGGIPVDQIWDPLLNGLDERFGGSADNVKQTFEGAIDRVRAVWRDLSADLAEPLVSAEGGGLLIDLANNAADAGREFRALPEPLKVATVAAGGLTAAGALLAGGFFVLAPRIVETMDSVNKLSEQFPRAAGAAKGFSKALGIATVVTGVTIATIKLADALGDSGLVASADAASAALVGVNGANLDSLFLDATAGTYDLNDAIGRLQDMNGLERWGLGAAASLGITSNSALNARTTFEQLDSTIASMVGSGDMEGAARLVELYWGQIDQTKYSHEDLMALLPQYQDALDGSAAGAELAAGANEELAGGLGQVEEQAISAAEAAATYREEWAQTALSAGESFGSMLTAYQSVIDKNVEMAESTAAATESSKDSWEDYYDGVSVDIADWITSMQEQQQATEDWAANYQTALAQIGQDVPATGRNAHRAFVQEMVAAGEEGAAALQAFVDGTPAQRQQLVDAWAGTNIAIQEVASDVEIPVTIDHEGATVDLNAAVVDWEAGTVTLPLDVETELADEAVAGFNVRTAEQTATMPLDADTAPADEAVDFWNSHVGDQPALLTVDADTTLAKGTVDAAINQFAGRTATITVNGVYGGTTGVPTPTAFNPAGLLKKATGGAIHGAGNGTSDSIAAMVSNNEHVWTEREVHAAGGHSAVEALRAKVLAGVPSQMLHFSTGGSVISAPVRVTAQAATAHSADGLTRADLDYLADRTARIMATSSARAGGLAHSSAVHYTDQAIVGQAVVRR